MCVWESISVFIFSGDLEFLVLVLYQLSTAESLRLWQQVWKSNNQESRKNYRNINIPQDIFLRFDRPQYFIRRYNFPLCQYNCYKYSIVPLSVKLINEQLMTEGQLYYYFNYLFNYLCILRSVFIKVYPTRVYALIFITMCVWEGFQCRSWPIQDDFPLRQTIKYS